MPHPRSPREHTEERERASLSGWATLSVESKGREQADPPDPLRTAFEVDIDRILASVAFDRLKGKSHRLLAPRGEGYRTRLDHTLAVARVARVMARSLRLNEDLAEAVALGSDLGATAFARAGDEAMSLFTDEPFRHDHQSLRVVESIENDRAGLNLSWEVRDGIACHTLDTPMPATREGEVVRLANRIADVVGEVRDAVATGVLLLSDVPPEVTAALGESPVEWVRTLLLDAVRASTDVPEVRSSTSMWSVLDALETFVAEHVADRHGVLAERARGSHCLSSLVVFHMDNPRRLPSPHRSSEDPDLVCVIDFVSSLSDDQARHLFGKLFVPRRGTSRQ